MEAVGKAHAVGVDPRGARGREPETDPDIGSGAPRRAGVPGPAILPEPSHADSDQSEEVRKYRDPVLRGEEVLPVSGEGVNGKCPRTHGESDIELGSRHQLLE